MVEHFCTILVSQVYGLKRMVMVKIIPSLSTECWQQCPEQIYPVHVFIKQTKKIIRSFYIMLASGLLSMAYNGCLNSVSLSLENFTKHFYLFDM